MMAETVQWCLGSRYYEDLAAALRSVDIDTVYGREKIELDSARLMKTPIRLYGGAPDLLGELGKTGPGDDGKNAIHVHKWMPEMTPAQGADRRLWAYLTHSVFFEYSKQRWGIQGGRDPARHIHNRWFMRGGRQGLLSNSVARLWWAAQLTFAPWEREPEYFAPLRDKYDDDYVFTRRLFSRQNMFQSLVARRFGSSFKIRICMLEAFERHAREHRNLSALSEAVDLRLNLVCSYRTLSALPFLNLMDTMETYVQQAMEDSTSQDATAVDGDGS